MHCGVQAALRGPSCPQFVQMGCRASRPHISAICIIECVICHKVLPRSNHPPVWEHSASPWGGNGRTVGLLSSPGAPWAHLMGAVGSPYSPVLGLTHFSAALLSHAALRVEASASLTPSSPLPSSTMQPSSQPPPPQ